MGDVSAFCVWCCSPPDDCLLGAAACATEPCTPGEGFAGFVAHAVPDVLLLGESLKLVACHAGACREEAASPDALSPRGLGEMRLALPRVLAGVTVAGADCVLRWLVAGA